MPVYKYIPDLGYAMKVGDEWFLIRPDKEPLQIEAPELYRAWLLSVGNPKMNALFNFPGLNAIVKSGANNLNIASLGSANIFTIPIKATEVLIMSSFAVWNANLVGQFIDEAVATLATDVKLDGQHIIPPLGGYTGISRGLKINKIMYGEATLTCDTTNNTASNIYVGVSWSAWILSSNEIDL